jgi:hypothetical protein
MTPKDIWDRFCRHTDKLYSQRARGLISEAEFLSKLAQEVLEADIDMKEVS